MEGIKNLFVDDLFGTGGNEMEQHVLTRQTKDSLVGSEDCDDVTFTRHRIRWTQDSQNGPYIEVSQNKATDELEEIPLERKTKEDLHCTPSQKIGEKDQVTAGEASILATHWTMENTWIS